jgi:hypothetical protein
LCAFNTDLPCQHSKLIDVTHTTRSIDEGRAAPPKMVTDYSRLFAETFGAPLPNDGEEEVEGDERPQSDSTLTDQEEVEALRQTLRKEGKELATWKKPANLGALSVQFDDLMGLASSNAKGKLVS